MIVLHSSSEIKTCDNREINLFCEGRLDSTSEPGNITWSMDGQPVQDSNLGHLLRQTHLTGFNSYHPASFLTIRVMQGETNGLYSCNVWYPGGVTLVEKENKSFNIQIESKCFAIVHFRGNQFCANLLFFYSQF